MTSTAATSRPAHEGRKLPRNPTCPPTIPITPRTINSIPAIGFQLDAIAHLSIQRSA
jgi:hypothetical protein